MSGPAYPVDVFISYAHADKKLLDALKQQLASLQQQKLIHTWTDRDILAGAEWEAELKQQLDAAALILLLISPAFIASRYCWDIEMDRALARHDKGEARVVPIILRPCVWDHLPFAKLQALPPHGKPVTTWNNRDDAFYKVTLGIRDGLKQLASRSPNPKAEPQPAKAESHSGRDARGPRRAQAQKPAAANLPATTSALLAPSKPAAGSEWVSPSGLVLVYVPGDEYTLGDNELEHAPIHRVRLSSFWIGKFAVTNAQFAQYLKAHPQQREPEFWGDKRFNQPAQPVVGVSFQEALAYCRWAGFTLPTEAQWEAAARGTDQRRYPWGDAEPTSEHAKFDGSYDRDQPAPVGSFPRGVGPFGTHDQAGNVWEWCLDLYREDAYVRRGDQLDPNEPGAESDESAWRVVRGGSWNDRSRFLRAAFRGRWLAWDRYRLVGFRVAAGGGSEHGN